MTVLRFDDASRQVKFRDPATARRLAGTIARVTREIGRSPVSVMHVCGSHEQAIAKFGLRATFPKELNVIMGPGCPVCITDMPEVDEGVALARQGVIVASYGDMLKVPGTVQSLADAQADPLDAATPARSSIRSLKGAVRRASMASYLRQISSALSTGRWAVMP